MMTPRAAVAVAAGSPGHSMLLFVLRHGKAEPGHPGEPDAGRRLTADGKQLLRSVLARAAAGGVNPQTMLASPYVRARETAEIVSETLGLAGTALPCNALVPASQPEALWQEVRLHQQVTQLILVGHNPLLSEFLTLLLGAAGYAIDLKPAGLARFSHTESAARRDKPASTSLRLLGVLTVLFKYASARQAARAS